jgi:hypothetical protein
MARFDAERGAKYTYLERTGGSWLSVNQRDYDSRLGRSGRLQPLFEATQMRKVYIGYTPYEALSSSGMGDIGWTQSTTS